MRCRICDKTMEPKEEPLGYTIRRSFDCPNKCYRIIQGDHGVNIYEIFGATYMFHFKDPNSSEILKRVIDYWKENERYLAEILERK